MKRLACCIAAAGVLLVAPAIAAGSTTRSRILALAARQIGYHDSGYFCTKYGPCELWCSLFVTWVWDHEGVHVPSLAFTGYLYDWSKTETYVLRPSAVPQPGDAVLFGSGPQTVDTSLHTGIVEAAYPGYLVTIEGDSAHAVRRYVVPIHHPQSVGEPGPIYAYASPLTGGGSLASARKASVERFPAMSREMIGRQASMASARPDPLTRAIASLRAFQHMPYQMPNAKINWTAVNPNGKVAVRVTSAKSLQAASAAWLRFLHRFDDAGRAYQVTFQATGTPPIANVPVAAAPPSITGAPEDGQTLTEEHGIWSNEPTSYAYQWEDCDTSGNSCSPIDGATGQTYALTPADDGHTVRVQEIAINASGPGIPVTSAPSAVVTEPLLGL